MIDIAILRQNPDLVRRTVRLRGSEVDVEALIETDIRLRQLQVDVEALRTQQKRHGKETDIGAARELRDRLRGVADETQRLQVLRDDLWFRLPNLLADDTPIGHGDEENVELRRVGSAVGTDVNRGHDLVGSKLGVLDLATGSRVAGSGFYYWRGDGARLAWALFSYTLSFLARRGFEQMFTPLVARDETFFGTGYLPFFADQTYRLTGTDLSLIGTSEQTLIGYYGDSMIAPDLLPIRVTAFTPCFRTEAGAAGRASRGAFRVHQFHKVEQIVICRPEESESMLAECQRNIEDLMGSLDLPYRVVRVCVGDLGAPAYKKYDTEAWFPGFGAYRETHSNSNLIDYQTRRFKIRFKEGGRVRFPHTISATGITDRAALAIMENRVEPDGSVVVPAVLRPLMGGRERLEPNTR